MHELGVTQGILDVVLRHAKENGANQVLAVHLRIGELSDVVDEWVQRVFDSISRQTIAAGAKLEVSRTPIVFRCNCEQEFSISKERLMGGNRVTCPACGGSNLVLCGGREFSVETIEVR